MGNGRARDDAFGSALGWRKVASLMAWGNQLKRGTTEGKATMQRRKSKSIMITLQFLLRSLKMIPGQNSMPMPSDLTNNKFATANSQPPGSEEDWLPWYLSRYDKVLLPGYPALFYNLILAQELGFQALIVTSLFGILQHKPPSIRLKPIHPSNASLSPKKSIKHSHWRTSARTKLQTSQ